MDGRPAVVPGLSSLPTTMLPRRSLELKGSFANYPFAEVAAEIRQAELSGSLRLAWEDKKSIVYFEDGKVVHAVSNARAHRLFGLLLEKKMLELGDLSGYPDFADDIKLAANLTGNGTFTAGEIDGLAVEQATAVIADVFSWLDGHWVFSPLARLRADIKRQIDVSSAILDHARNVTPEFAAQRFKSVKETFDLAPCLAEMPALLPEEGFILSRFEGRPLNFEEIRMLSGLPDQTVALSLYTLWLVGILKRGGWNAAFSAGRLDEIRRARLSLAKDVTKPAAATNRPAENTAPAANEKIEPVADVDISISEYLGRVERADTLYEVLGVTTTAKLAEIKRAYFSMAKLFHPDKYHRESADTLRRVQHAFTELAHAYDVLKSQQSRDSYDLKLKKDQEAKKRAGEAGQVSVDGSGVGFESFQQGVEFLREGDTETAAKCFARAVHYTPNNAVYHAHFGKALSADERHKHRAETEFQTAVRLDPKDPKIRMMLVEFLVDMNMTKRAEGELKRFLEISPGNTQAMKMLADLQK